MNALNFGMSRITLSTGTKRYMLFAVRRIVIFVIQVFAVISIIWWLFRLSGINPIALYIQQYMESGMATATGAELMKMEEYVKGLEAMYGLNQPIWVQYLKFMWQILHGNFGPSIISNPYPVQVYIAWRLPWTIGLLGVATAISWVVGVFLGVFVGWRRGTKLDAALTYLAVAFSQVPYYIIAIIGILVFAYMLGVLPAYGGAGATVKPGFNLPYIISLIRHAILPGTSLAIISALGWLLSTRFLTVGILGEDFMLFAEAKGLTTVRMINRYVLKNVMLPQVTGLGIAIAGIFSGALIVEAIFGYPGIGSALSSALGAQDFQLAQAIIDIAATATLAATTVLDLIYPFIDPRVRY